MTPASGPVPITSLLVLGGARSGKSAFAQARAEASGLDPVFVATAQAYDGEMAARIAAHRAARDARWRLVEVAEDLPGALRAEAATTRILLVDCMTLWLSTLVLGDHDVDAATRDLASALAALSGPAILVSNEVGSGIVPATPLGRRFRDAQGRLNQQLAATCDAAVLVVAGQAIDLKPQHMPRFAFRPGGA